MGKHPLARESWLAGYRQAVADMRAGQGRSGPGRRDLVADWASERERALVVLREITGVIGDPNYSGGLDLDVILRRCLLQPVLVMLGRVVTGQVTVSGQ